MLRAANSVIEDAAVSSFVFLVVGLSLDTRSSHEISVFILRADLTRQLDPSDYDAKIQ